jgi:D-tagatose-1,6-bisphosphate aldolase subunit GatZ/KbaZ
MIRVPELKVLRRNRELGQGGTYAVCSAHPAVVEPAIQQALSDGSVLHVESTSSQINQFGGYAGLTPSQFARFVHDAASRARLPANRVLLGGDHVGPFPWREEPSARALRKACDHRFRSPFHRLPISQRFGLDGG